LPFLLSRFACRTTAHCASSSHARIKVDSVRGRQAKGSVCEEEEEEEEEERRKR
jgi:hypothetical protein